MRKRVLCLLLCLCLAASLTLPAFAQQRSSVIYIRNLEDLLSLAKNCRLDRYSQGKTVYLECDLDLTNVDFDGIPTFGGTFDGKGHTVSGLEIKADCSTVGMFRYVQPGGVVRDLKVSGQIAPGGTAATVGGIVGSNRGLIADCCFEGSVAGRNSVGCIAGVNESGGSILRCVSQGVVVGENMTGGITGMNRGLVENCQNRACVNIHTPDASVDLSQIDLSVLIDPGSLSAGTIVMDTGGIAGYSMGAIYGCVNTASVGYPHIGYNVGGIAGRSNGIISGCINRATIQGRKDVGGIVGQMEPNVSLDLSEDYLKQLQTQVEELAELTRQLQDGFDMVGSVNSHLNETLTHIDCISTSLETLTGHIGEYGTDLTNEFNRVSLLLQDTMSQLLPVLEQVMDLSKSLEKAMHLFSHSMSVLADAAQSLEGSIALMNAAMADLHQATEQISQASEQIAEGVQLLAATLQSGEPEQVKAALKQMKDGLQQFSDATGQAGEAAQKIADALQQDGTWNDDTAAGFAEALQAVADMGDALQTLTDGITNLLEHIEFDQDAFWLGVDSLRKGMESLNLAMDSLESATEKLSLSLTLLEQAVDRGGNGLEIIASAMSELAYSMRLFNKLTEQIKTVVDNICHYEPFQLPQLDSEAQESADVLFDSINAISDELRDILAISDTFSHETKQLLNAISEKFNEMLATAMKLADQVMDTTTGGIIKDTSDVDIDAVQSGKVSTCRNEGNVFGDINAGGIAGAMAIEYQMDPEDDFSVDLSQHRLRTYQAKAVIAYCTNLAPIQGKRSYVGGICGRMNMGFITDSAAFGVISSVDGDYVGGIAGSAAGPIRRCGVKADLSGGKYVGGVAGLATTVSDCRAMVQLEGREFLGAVLGYAEDIDLEYIIANLYFELPDSPGAIDDISYDGCAQAASWASFMDSMVTQQYFDQTELTFHFADGSTQKLTLPVGAVLEHTMVPQLENTAQHICYWEGLEAQLGRAQYFNRTFVETRKAKTTVLESIESRDNGKAIVLLQGSFLGTEKFSLQRLTDVPEALEGWSYTVPEGGTVTQLRYAIPEGAEQLQILARDGSGTLQQVPFTLTGSYAVFSLEEGVTAFYVMVPIQESWPTQWIIAVSAAAVLLIAVGIMLSRRKKKKAK